jgi:hypothetical protein
MKTENLASIIKRSEFKIEALKTKQKKRKGRRISAT